MNKSILQIFNRNTFLLGILDKTIYYFRIQNYDAALRNVTMVIDHVSLWLKDVSEQKDYFNKEYDMVNLDVLSELLGGLMDAQKKTDYILLADLYELQLIPFLYQLQEYILSGEDITYDQSLYDINLAAVNKYYPELYQDLINITSFPDLSQEYKIEYTSSGLKTLAYQTDTTSFYLHSNRNAIDEAFQLANSWYQDDKSKYIVYGLGLGYHITELANLDNGIRIDVYESDINVIQNACAHSRFDLLIQNENIHINYDPDLKKLMKQIEHISEETELVIHYPSLKLIKNSSYREMLETYFIHYSSIKNQLRQMNSNFRDNITNYDKPVDLLKDKFMGKDLYIVAAGPSLDKNYQYLRQVGENSIVLATGTVFKKLYHAGIRPDYFIVSDAYPRIYAQVNGLEKETIPMIFLSTAFKGFAKNYAGEKFLVCQKGYNKAEEFAEKYNYKLYNTGGSVSTIALDLGIQFECKRIIFVGLDLGYPDNLVHAANTSRRGLVSTENLIQVTDIYGKQIYTTKTLDIYRKWIENQIKNVKNIEFIDATEGGAKIQGMRIAKLEDIIFE